MVREIYPNPNISKEILQRAKKSVLKVIMAKQIRRSKNIIKIEQSFIEGVEFNKLYLSNGETMIFGTMPEEYYTTKKRIEVDEHRSKEFSGSNEQSKSESGEIRG